MPVVIVMMAVSLLTGLATTVVLGTITETAIAGNYGEAAAVFYAAEAAVEFALAELTAADWEASLTDTTLSAFIDGPPAGLRHAGIAPVDLTQATADINALRGARAAGSAYRLYAYGRFADLVSARPEGSRLYVAVWVADLTDAAAEGTGAPVLGVLGRAYGPSGSRRAIAVSVTPGDVAPRALRVLSWAELR